VDGLREQVSKEQPMSSPAVIRSTNEEEELLVVLRDKLSLLKSLLVENIQQPEILLAISTLLGFGAVALTRRREEAPNDVAVEKPYNVLAGEKSREGSPFYADFVVDKKKEQRKMARATSLEEEYPETAVPIPKISDIDAVSKKFKFSAGTASRSSNGEEVPPLGVRVKKSAVLNDAVSRPTISAVDKKLQSSTGSYRQPKRPLLSLVRGVRKEREGG
jgi:hypothetical protein